MKGLWQSMDSRVTVTKERLSLEEIGSWLKEWWKIKGTWALGIEYETLENFRGANVKKSTDSPAKPVPYLNIIGRLMKDSEHSGPPPLSFLCMPEDTRAQLSSAPLPPCLPRHDGPLFLWNDNPKTLPSLSCLGHVLLSQQQKTD